MALGSGSSFSTYCSARRRGSPFSLQLCSEGKASLLHQVWSQNPSTAQESGWLAAILISRSRRREEPRQLAEQSSKKAVERHAGEDWLAPRRCTCRAPTNAFRSSDMLER